MANEIKSLYTTQKTLYVLIISGTSIWNGTALELISIPNWQNYAILMTETAVPGLYYASIPTSLPLGKFVIIAYLQSGDTPASGDIAERVGQLIWNGFEEVDLSDIAIGTEVNVNVDNISITTGVGNSESQFLPPSEPKVSIKTGVS